MKKKYTYVTVKGDDNSLIATVPELPGIIAQGATMEELSPRIKESITAYVQTMQKEKLDIPQDFQLVDVNEVEIEL